MPVEYPFALLSQEICQGPNMAEGKVTLQPGLRREGWGSLTTGDGSRDPEVSMMTERGKGTSDPQRGSVGLKQAEKENTRRPEAAETSRIQLGGHVAYPYTDQHEARGPVPPPNCRDIL